jgi:transcriptional/translational regulatory protein YebC/TACO1
MAEVEAEGGQHALRLSENGAGLRHQVAGADDVATDDEGGIEVLCEPVVYAQVRAALEQAGLKAEVAEITMKPMNETVLEGDDAARMQKLLDAIENLDDVQQVFTSAVIDE